MTAAFVRVAPDGSGKQMSTDEITDVLGNDVHVQNAVLVGDTKEMLTQIMNTDTEILKTLRAIHRVLSETTTSQAQPDDFNSGQEI